MTLKIHLLPLSFSLSYQDLKNCYCDCHTGLEGGTFVVAEIILYCQNDCFFLFRTVV